MFSWRKPDTIILMIMVAAASGCRWWVGVETKLTLLSMSWTNMEVAAQKRERPQISGGLDPFTHVWSPVALLLACVASLNRLILTIILVLEVCTSRLQQENVSLLLNSPKINKKKNE